MLTVMPVFVGTSKAVQNHPLRAALSLINPIHSLIEGPHKRAFLVRPAWAYFSRVKVPNVPLGRGNV